MKNLIFAQHDDEAAAAKAAFNEKRDDVKPVVEWKVGKVLQEGGKEAKKDEI